MTGQPNFTSWLARMERNQTAIGTFAREVAQDTTWPRTANTRGAFLGYLIEHEAPAPRIAAFNKAWASYQTAISRAQDVTQEAATQDEKEPAQEVQSTTVAIVLEPIDAPCTECGGGLNVVQWTIPNIGEGVLCRSCLDAVIAEFQTALGLEVSEE